MLDSVGIALERDRARREQDSTVHDVKVHFESLTPREQEVMGFVTAGLMNKQIAAKLGVSEITVKVHRGNVMRKMGEKLKPPVFEEGFAKITVVRVKSAS